MTKNTTQYPEPEPGLKPVPLNTELSTVTTRPPNVHSVMNVDRLILIKGNYDVILYFNLSGKKKCESEIKNQ